MNEIKNQFPEIEIESKKKIILQERKFIDRNIEEGLPDGKLLNNEINIEKKPETIKDSDVDKKLDKIITIEANLPWGDKDKVINQINDAIQREIRKKLYDAVIKATSRMIEEETLQMIKEAKSQMIVENNPEYKKYLNDVLTTLQGSYRTIKEEISEIESKIYEKRQKKRDFIDFAGFLERSTNHFIDKNIKSPQKKFNEIPQDLKDIIKNYIERKIKRMCQCKAGKLTDSNSATTKKIVEQMKIYIAYHKCWNSDYSKTMGAIDNIRDAINSGIKKKIKEWRDKSAENQALISGIINSIKEDTENKKDTKIKEDTKITPLQQFAAICMSNITATIGEQYLNELLNNANQQELKVLDENLILLKKQLKDKEDEIKCLQGELKRKQSSVEDKIKEKNEIKEEKKEDKKEKKKEEKKGDKKEDKKEENNIKYKKKEKNISTSLKDSHEENIEKK